MNAAMQRSIRVGGLGSHDIGFVYCSTSMFRNDANVIPEFNELVILFNNDNKQKELPPIGVLCLSPTDTGILPLTGSRGMFIEIAGGWQLKC